MAGSCIAFRTTPFASKVLSGVTRASRSYTATYRPNTGILYFSFLRKYTFDDSAFEGRGSVEVLPVEAAAEFSSGRPDDRMLSGGHLALPNALALSRSAHL